MKSTSKQVHIPMKAGRQRKTSNPAHLLTGHAVDALLAKKARDVLVMDMRDVSGIADYFVICTGDSDLQIKALADVVKEWIRERFDERPWHTEGKDYYQWVLIDYVDVVVHIFNDEKRAFYDLERLWGDAPSERVADDGSAADLAMLQM